MDRFSYEKASPVNRRARKRAQRSPLPAQGAEDIAKPAISDLRFLKSRFAVPKMSAA